MKTITTSVCLLLFAISFSQININEVDSDQEGTDVMEFVELLSNSPNFSLEGYVLVFYNGSDDESYRSVDLNGYVTDANGFFIIGSNETPGADITIGASNTIQNGADAIAVYIDEVTNFPNGTPVTDQNLIDAVVYGTGDDNDQELLVGLGQTVQYDEDLNANKDMESIQRDGTGSFCVKAPTLRDTNSCILGISEVNVQIFKMFPNPAKADYVQITSKIDSPKHISIFNILGAQIIKTTLLGEKLDISYLKSGIYILRIEQQKTSTTMKLVIQ